MRIQSGFFLFICLLLVLSPIRAQNTKNIHIQVDSLFAVCQKLEKDGNHEKSLPLRRTIFDFCDRSAVFQEKEKLMHLRYLTDCLLYNRLFTECAALSEKGLARQILETGNQSFDCIPWYTFWGFAERKKYDFPVAERLYQAGYEIARMFPDSNSLHVCELYSNYAVLSNLILETERAEFLYNQCFSCNEKLYGKQSRHYAQTALSYAHFLLNIGDLEKSEEMLELGFTYFDTHKEEFTTNGQYYYYRMVELYSKKNNLQKAQEYHQKAIEYCENFYGPNSIEVIQASNNFYYFRLQKEETTDIEPGLLKNKAFYKENYKEQSRNYAVTCGYLGRLYTLLDRYQESEKTLLEADSIFKTLYRPTDVKYHFFQSFLHKLYAAQENYPKVLEALELSYSNHWASFDSSSIKLSQYYHLKGKYQCLNGDYEAGVENLITGATIQKQDIASQAHFFTENELSFRTQYYAQWADLHLALLDADQSQSAKLRQLCYEDAIFQKGFLMSNIQNTRKKIGSSPKAKAIQKRLQYLTNIIALASNNKDTNSNKLKKVREETQTLEKTLVKLVRPDTDTEAMTSMEEMMHVLGENEAVLEFVRFHPLQKGAQSSRETYAALLLQNRSLEYIPLFESDFLTKKLDKKNLSTKGYINQIYHKNGGKTALFSDIWQPIFKKIPAKKTLFYAPSGTLYRLALHLLADSTGKTATEYQNLVLLASSRFLVNKEETDFVKKDAFLIGGVNFDKPSQTSGKQLSGAERPALQWTLVEVDSVQKVLEKNGFATILKYGDDATESLLKSIGSNPKTGQQSPRILHISTHGYFFKNPEEVQQSSPSDDFLIKTDENPMIRSGLLMAGANSALQNPDSLKASQEDGILTAYEISQLDLSQTEIVILSACDTGLGDVQGNEGVYGLQRAFKIAKAKHIMMALWQVPDWHTKELMLLFYNNWIIEELEPQAALAKAQVTMRELGHEPYYWAGFVLLN